MIAKTTRQRGVTLIELVIVTMIIGILSAVLAPVMVSSLRAYQATLGDVVVLDKLRYATERLAREIREVSYDYSGNSFQFASMGANSMQFTRVFYDAAGAASAPTTVTVGNTGSAVTLAYSTPVVAAQVLTDELQTLTFTYLDKDGGTSGITVSNVQSVRITLTLVHNGNQYTQETQVELKSNS